MLTTERKHLESREVGDVTVVTFPSSHLIEEEQIRDLGAQFLQLLDDGHAKVLINFSGVKFVSSTMLGKLMELEKRIKIHDGQLVLCGIVSEVYKAFSDTKLNKLFNICDTEAAGLSRF